MAGFAYLKYEDEYGVPQIEPANEMSYFDHSAVDFDHLQRFTLGNRGLEVEVLNLFRTQSEIYIQRLRNAADDVAWREAAHTLKGSAAGIGAHRVHAAATDCEQLNTSERESHGPELIRVLESRLEEANLLIAKFLND